MTTLARIAIKGLLLLPVTTVMAAPMGYSVNSDEPMGDSLYRIDLATGSETKIGTTVQSAGTTRTDIEGLAFDRNNVLWGVDDESLKLFSIDTGTGLVNFQDEVTISGLGAVQGNDFGLTFTCRDELYVSTVSNQTLYRLGLDGAATAVGSLGVNISAIAAYGNPVRLYGLGNGKLGEGNGLDNRSLYEIDTGTGAATPIGELGAAAGDYFEGGLSFDVDGTLWAITDRRTFEDELGSEVLTLDLETGAATLRSTTSVTGFESLAVAPPSGCDAEPPPAGEPRYPQFEGIPTLGDGGRLLAILLISLAAFLALRRP